MTPIQEKYRYLQNKYEQWQLGREQIGEEQYTTCGKGKFQDYIGRFSERDPIWSIYWSPETGAYEVHGGIRAKWMKLGSTQHYLGFPISDEEKYKDNKGKGAISHFQGGAIIWYERTNTRVIYKKIDDSLIMDEKELTPLEKLKMVGKAVPIAIKIAMLLV